MLTSEFSFDNKSSDSIVSSESVIEALIIDNRVFSPSNSRTPNRGPVGFVFDKCLGGEGAPKEIPKFDSRVMA